jgi:hypothetical protein
VRWMGGRAGGQTPDGDSTCRGMGKAGRTVLMTRMGVAAELRG